MLKKLIKIFRSGPRNVEDLVAYPEGKRIYRDFHNLRRDLMDQDALKVINRLNRHGYRSYLVGGCVRDMILGKRPKDFDVVTNATPSQIRKIFSNSRTIGRRFKIVHIMFRGGKVIEVSTFRSLPDHRLASDKNRNSDYMLLRDNQYGQPIEDAARRDFTINALFFDPRNESIIDYVGGYDDIQNRRITVIGDPDISFQEDPVRMLRAAKFSALINFEMDGVCQKAIRRNKDEIIKASPSRMLEEYYKIFRTGRSYDVFQKLAELGIFRVLFPEASEASDRVGIKVENFEENAIGMRFKLADKMLHEREELTTTIYIALILLDLVRDVFVQEQKHKNLSSYIKDQIDEAVKGLNLSGKDRDRLLQIYISQARFIRDKQGKRMRPDIFRQKVFFYEAFMVFKIHSIIEKNEEFIQKSMFWEFGPRQKPPEFGKIISMFPIRRNGPRDRDGGKDYRDGKKGRDGGGNRSSDRKRRGNRGKGNYQESAVNPDTSDEFETQLEEVSPDIEDPMLEMDDDQTPHYISDDIGPDTMDDYDDEEGTEEEKSEK